MGTSCCSPLAKFLLHARICVDEKHIIVLFSAEQVGRQPPVRGFRAQHQGSSRNNQQPKRQKEEATKSGGPGFIDLKYAREDSNL
jgi:hypothetical protein